MKKITLFLFLAIRSLHADCVISPPSNLALSTKSTIEQLKKTLSHSGCDNIELRKFLSLIKDYRGLLTSRQVAREGFHKSVSLKNSFHILSLNDFIKKYIDTHKKFSIDKSTFTGTQKSLVSYDNFDDIRIQCKQCHTLGEKTARLVLIDKKGITHTHWLKFNIVSNIEAIVPTETISVNHKSLNDRLFKKKTISTMSPEVFHTDFKSLKYKMANSVLKMGSPILKRSLSAARLINVGQTVTVQLRQGNLNLKAKAIPVTSGSYGDSVTMKNQRTKKMITGKVIGKNLVEVEL